MDKNVVLAVFLFLIVVDASNAQFRKLAAAPQENKTTSTQVLGENKPDPNPIDAATEQGNGTDLRNPSQLNEKDNRKSGGNPMDDGKTPKHVNGTDLLSPPANEKDNGKSGGKEMDNGQTPKLVNGTDLPNPPAKEKDNGKSGGNETDSAKIRKHVNDTELLSPPTNEKDDGKNSGNEKVNGKNDRIEEHAVDDKNSSPVKKTDNGKDGGTKEDSTHDKSNSELGVNETCDGLPKCTDLSALIACIQNFDTGSREFTVLVQNDGEKTLTVNLTVPTAVENPLKPLKLSKRQSQKINILLSAVKNNKLILNAGNGECVLHMDHPESENVFIYLPSYDKLVTPINGAYSLILSVLVFGGTWAYCKLRKRRWREGVPYQELEMGLPESIPTTNVETAEGWDQGWDDDWDEVNAVNSPATRLGMGSISANSLTSRSPNRDGWEQDWGD